VTVNDAQRHTTKLQLRLPPDVAREIRALSAASGVQVSTLVALAWAVARRGGLDAALATVARAAGRARPHRARAEERRPPSPTGARLVGAPEATGR